MKAETPGLRRTSINLVSTWANKVGGSLFPIVIVPIIARQLGVEGLAIWLLVAQYTNHLQLLGFGINTCLGRFLARYRTLGDGPAVSRYLSTSLISLSVLALLILTVAPFIAWSFQSIFGLSEGRAQEIFWLVLLASISVGLGLPLRTGVGLLSSIHHFDRIALWEFLSMLLRFSFVVAGLLWFEPNLAMLGLLYFAPVLLFNAVLFMDGLQRFGRPKVSLNTLTPSAFFALFSVSASAMVITLSAVLLRQASPMLTGYFMDAEAIVIISLPLLIVFGLSPFVMVANQLLAPVASQMDSRDDREKLQVVYLVASSYALSLSSGLLLVLYYLSSEILEIWLGNTGMSPSALDDIAKMAVVLFAAFSLAVPSLVGRSVLVAVGEHWLAARAEITISVFGLTVGCLLMTLGGMGVMGMAAGIALALATRGMGMLMVGCARYFKVSYANLMAAIFLKPMTVIVSSITIASVLLSGLLEGSNIAQMLVASVLWLIGTWRLVITGNHRAKLYSAIRNLSA